MNTKTRPPFTRLKNAVLRLLWTGQLAPKACTHLDQVREVGLPVEHVCPDCVALGDSWLHLRQCLTCGYVGCCDKAKNQHSFKHFEATGHPLMRSIEPGEDWMWCYIDQALL